MAPKRRSIDFFRSLLGAVVILSALTEPTATSSAQGPAAPTAFDGKYVGTATHTGGRADGCATLTSVDMTITGGQVVIHETYFNGGRSIFRGSVNTAGEVSAFFFREKSLPTNVGPTVDSLSGTIHDKVFAGLHVNGYWCYYSVQMGPASAPTTPFDGDYTGVSREVLDSGSDEHRCTPRALMPPAPLKIANGVVGNPGVPFWEGTVSPQGAVVIRNRKFSRVDGQINRQGTIRGQDSGELPPSVLAQIDGGGTNCIVKFVWQRE